jgi:hypothetical protein
MSEMTVNVLAIINAASEPIETLFGPFLKRMKFPLPPPERPAQFSLRHVFALMVVLSVCLALVTQLRHIGWALSIGAIGMAIGWWRHDWRLSAAAGTALSIFVLTYVASWVRMEGELMRGSSADITRYVFLFNSTAIDEYKSIDGSLPDSLDALELSTLTELPRMDGWGGEIHYRRHNEEYELVSFGRDQQPGGAGLDADVVYRSTKPYQLEVAPLTIRQFLFEADGSIGIFQAAIVASLLTAITWYATNWREDLNRPKIVIELTIAIASAVCAAVVLAYFYVAAAGSSH